MTTILIIAAAIVFVWALLIAISGALIGNRSRPKSEIEDDVIDRDQNNGDGSGRP